MADDEGYVPADDSGPWERVFVAEGVPEGRCGLTFEYNQPFGLGSSVTCWRDSWRDRDRCIWHADAEGKLPDELTGARGDESERLDGAVLRNVELSDRIFRNIKLGDRIGFADCVLAGADFSDAGLRNVNLTHTNLKEADFTDADLRMADLSDADLWKADLTDADMGMADLVEAYLAESVLTGASLSEADLTHAYLPNTDLTDANLQGADLIETDIRVANLTNAELNEADLTDTDLYNTDLTDTHLQQAVLTDGNLEQADFSNAILGGSNFVGADLTETRLTGAGLSGADFSDAELRRAEFTDAALRDADLTGATARSSTFDNAMLENAILTRTDLREASLEGADLFQAQFSDTRINSQTEFGDVCSYEADMEPPDSMDVPDETDETVAAMRGATWVYRRLETLHDENAMADRTREFHIRKEEAQRELFRRKRERGRYAVSTLNRYLTYHGESIGHLLAAWAVTIFVAGLLYPFVGGVEDNGEVYRIPLTTDIPSPAELAAAGEAIARGLYFSIITFTTIGYANVAPHGIGSRILVGIESLLGAIMVALFVYVLGRRVAR